MLTEEQLAKLESSRLFREEILAMPKESALERLRELYSRDPRPFYQDFAKSRTSLEAVYYGMVTGED